MLAMMLEWCWWWCWQCQLWHYNLTKLVGKEFILRPFGQFLLTKISLFGLFIYKWHLFKFVRIRVKEKIFFIFILNPTMPNIWQVKKEIIGKNGSCLAHQSKGHLMSFISGYFLNRSTSRFINFFEGLLVFEVISKLSRLESSSLTLFTT